MSRAACVLSNERRCFIVPSDGTIKKRKDGRYELQIVVGKTLNGKYLRKSFYGNGPRDVKMKRDIWLEKNARNELLSKEIGFSEWALQWVETYKKPNIAITTYKNTYLNYINNYFICYFKNVKLSDIKPVDIQSFFNLHADKSSSVLDKLKKVLNQIFEAAIDNDLCCKNPCRGIKLPVYTKIKEKKVYTKRQADIVLEFAKTHKFGLGIIIILKTGLRRGELLALTWNDIDLDNNVLMVRHAVTSSDVIGNPKTDAGKRDIPFDSMLRTELIKNKSEGYVIKNNKNSFMQSNNWNNRYLRPFMQDLHKAHQDIPELSAHELRHTYGTLLREAGVDIYTIQKVMGHSDIKVTADTYVHNDLSVLKRNMLLEK